ncbi:MAG: hypothetical protein AAGD13_04635 [Pseudomonadota bacterium]
MMNMAAAAANTVEIPLARQVSDEVAGDIEKESVFVSPQIERIVVSEDRAHATLLLRDGDATDETLDKARRYLDVMAKHLSGFEVKVLFETVRKDSGDYISDAHQGLVDRGWVHDYGKGQVAYSGPVLKLAHFVNAEAEKLYSQVFQTKDAYFPSFIDHETLQKCGYIESHPNAVSFVASVVEDFDKLEAYRLANSCGAGPAMPPNPDIHHAGMCLNPAACLPAYPTLQGKQIGPEGHIISWLGRVFRYESRNISGLDRLYEFNVREIVFVGSEEFVAERRERALPLVVSLAETLDLDMSLQSATDPFFATVSAAKKFFQQAHDVKNEILLSTLKPDGSKKLLAGGSVNMHGTFFGERFDITTEDGSPAHTGCIGLGIERWVVTAFTQHGFDPDRWPERVRDAIFSD